MDEVFWGLAIGWFYALAVFLGCMAGLAVYLWIWSRHVVVEDDEKNGT